MKHIPTTKTFPAIAIAKRLCEDFQTQNGNSKTISLTIEKLEAAWIYFMKVYEHIPVEPMSTIPSLDYHSAPEFMAINKHLAIVNQSLLEHALSEKYNRTHLHADHRGDKYYLEDVLAGAIGLDEEENKPKPKGRPRGK